jgi:hypothetical protein
VISLSMGRENRQQQKRTTQHGKPKFEAVVLYPFFVDKGDKVKLSSLPWPLMRIVFGLMGLFNSWMDDLKKMFDFFFSGEYVADTSLQKKVFGKVPNTKEAVSRYFEMIHLKKK